MAVIQKLEAFSDNNTLGVTLEKAYVRLILRGYDFENERWVFTLKYYLSKESREFERLSDYFCKKYQYAGMQGSTPLPEKAANVSDENWAKILYFCTRTGQVREVMVNGFSIHKSVFEVESITDRDAILTEAYRHLRLGMTTAEDDLDTSTIPELLEKYLPGYTED